MKNIWIALGLSLFFVASIVGVAMINAHVSNDARFGKGHHNKEKFIIEQNTTYNTGIDPNTTSVWVQDGVIIYTNSGSSSCPPVIEKVKKVGRGHYEIYVQQYGKRACTMDMRPVSQIVKKASGKDFKQSDIVEIVNDSGNVPTEPQPSDPQPEPGQPGEPQPEPQPKPTDPTVPTPPTQEPQPMPEETKPPQTDKGQDGVESPNTDSSSVPKTENNTKD